MLSRFISKVNNDGAYLKKTNKRRNAILPDHFKTMEADIAPSAFDT